VGCTTSGSRCSPPHLVEALSSAHSDQGDVTVAAGLFTVVLDFGPAVFAATQPGLRSPRGRAPAGDPSLPSLHANHSPPHRNSLFAVSSPWSGILGMPSGFADGVDDDSGGDITSVGAGLGLSGGGLAGDVSLGVDFGGLALPYCCAQRPQPPRSVMGGPRGYGTERVQRPTVGVGHRGPKQQRRRNWRPRTDLWSLDYIRRAPDCLEHG